MHFGHNADDDEAMLKELLITTKLSLCPMDLENNSSSSRYNSQVDYYNTLGIMNSSLGLFYHCELMSRD